MHSPATLHMLVTTDAAVAFLLLYFIPLLGQALMLFLGFSPNAVVSLECSIVMLMFGAMLRESAGSR